MKDKIETHEAADPSAKREARQQSAPGVEPSQAALGRALSLPASRLTPPHILALQGAIGNMAVQRLLNGLTPASPAPTTVRAKLAVSAPGDKRGPEALQVARQAADASDAPATRAGPESVEGRSEDTDAGEVETAGSAGPLAVKEMLEIPEVKATVEKTEDFTVGGESHVLSFRVIDGELELGIASLEWTQLSEIDALIHERIGNNNLHQNYRLAWRNLDAAKRRHQRAADALAKTSRQRRESLPAGLRHKPPRAIALGLQKNQSKKYQRLTAKMMGEGIRLQEATTDFQQKARQFILTAFNHHGPAIGDILAHLAPTHVAAPHNALNVTANTYRYHEGTQADPIPIVWYKPLNQYPAMNLNAYDNAGHVQAFNLAYPGGGTVYDAQGRAYAFGVAGANQVPGKVTANGFDIRNARQAYTRTNQQQLNQVIQGFGFNMNNIDGDHVKDLGFGGTDTINNFWPLPRAVNQRAMVWRQAYRFHFKEQDNHGNWVLRSATINGLPGKSFRIKTEENQDVPAESGQNNGVAAGNETTYGNAQVINVNGGNVQEL